MNLTEQQKNCPYCHEKGGDYYVKPIEDIPHHSMGLVHRKDGWHIWTSGYDYDGYESIDPIKGCPICRRPLSNQAD